ncbi:MAG: DNA polymerase-3 subunit gamma/tau [Limisphaerales bacterium]
MESFVVSARKYRPARFADVVGQEHVVQTLQNAIRSGQLAHSFLFTGPRGVGKTTCARILAQTINCTGREEEADPCGQCESCLAFTHSSSFNIHELDAASNNSVDDIRTLTDQVRIPPQAGKYKVYIIDEVHMLSQAAFNAFLKTLEEPPPYAIFILATTEKHKIIPTILSRCQIFDFRRIRIPDMVSHLKTICDTEQVSFEEDGLHLIAQKADGALRDSLSMYDRIASYSSGTITLQDVLDNLNLLDYDVFFGLTESFLSEDMAAVLHSFRDALEKGFEGDVFLGGLAEHFRNLLVARDVGTSDLIELSGNLKTRYLNQADLVPASFLVSALSLINQSDINYRMSKHKRLHVEMALIKLTYLNRAVSLDPTSIEIKASSDSASKKKPDPKVISHAAEIISEQVKTAVKLDLDSRKGLKSASVAKKKELAPLVELEPSVAKSIEPVIKPIAEKIVEPSTELQSEIIAESAEASETNSASLFGEMPDVKTSAPASNLIPSFEDLAATVAEEKKEAGLLIEDPEEEILEGEVIPQHLLEKHWEEFGKEIANDKMAVSKLIEAAKVETDQSGEVRILVDNTIQQELIKEEIGTFRRKMAKASLILGEVKVIVLQGEMKEDNRAYTSKEQLKKMAEKNPLINKLKENLGLELDF